MLKCTLFTLIMLAFMLSCADSARDNKAGDIGSGEHFMPADGLAPSPINDIQVFSYFPSIADSFAYIQAQRSFALLIPSGKIDSFVYLKKLVNSGNFALTSDGSYINSSDQKEWSATSDGSQSLWADTAASLLTTAPIADFLNAFPPIEAGYSDVIMLSYMLTFDTAQTSAITHYRSKMDEAYNCGAAADEAIAITCTAKLRNAYLTFETRNAGKSLVWSVGYE